MLIRVAEAEDVAAVVALERTIPTAPHWPETAYGLALEAGRLFVAEAGGVLVGFAVGRVAVGEGELESVAVADAWRRLGVGRELCAAVIHWAGAAGAELVDLEVRASSEGARALYRALGFKQVGLRRDYYAEPREDAVLMRLGRAG